MGGNTHIIHRINLEINVPSIRLADQVKEDAIRLLNNEILPKLDKYLDTIELADECFQFNQLNIKLENLLEENFEQEFSGLIEQAFHEKIEKVIELKDQSQKEEVTKYTREEQILESFIFFLKTGRRPWWSEKSGEVLTEQNLSEILNNSSPEFQAELLSLLRENNIVLGRLLNQYSLQFIFQIIIALEKVQEEFAKDELTRKIILLFQNFSKKKNFTGFYLPIQLQSALKNIIMQLISRKRVYSEQQLSYKLDELSAKIASLDPIDQTDLKSLFDEINEEVTLSDIENKESFIFLEKQTATETTTVESLKRSQKKTEEEEDGIFLNNAGLVLLYPFFESFLIDFDLLAEGQFKDTESQMVAIHLLHYLATKEVFAAEYELGMEKFLCGWDLDLFISKNIELSPAMKDECETLLLAAIRHWSALKSTSPDGLREGFLQREGKLILNDFQNRLIIENKAQDVLLSHLPWSYSMIKLPWMDGILITEWI